MITLLKLSKWRFKEKVVFLAASCYAFLMQNEISFPIIEKRIARHPGLLILPAQVAVEEAWCLPEQEAKKVAIEYCSGNGEWVINRVKEDPSCLWIAVEKRFDRAKKIWKKKQQEQLDNLYLIYGEAKTATRAFIKPHAVDEIYINFPDPWPKRRHDKNRLIKEDFLKELHRILKEKGRITFVSDDLNYIQETKRVFLEYSAFEEEIIPFEYGTSFFCRLWQEKGRTIYHLHFRKRNGDSD
jgi:tRNA (guanine-N7-)-methyltransferase